MEITYPAKWPRSLITNKSPEADIYKTTLKIAIGKLEDELRKCKQMTDCTLSTHARINQYYEFTIDVYHTCAVLEYTTVRGKQLLVCDKFRSLANNIHALAIQIECWRTMKRIGTQKINIPPPAPVAAQGEIFT